jgi:hypothetical protein
MFKQWKPYFAGFGSALALVAAIAVPLVGINLGAWAAPHQSNDYDAIAQQSGLSIVWQVPPTCAHAVGCFTPLTPNTIYVKPGQSNSETYFTVLHEMAHAMQYRLQVPQNECNADRFAELFLAVSDNLNPCPKG